MKLQPFAQFPGPGAITALLCGVLFVGLCDVHGPRWNYRTYALFTPVRSVTADQSSAGHIEALGPMLTPEHEPGRLTGVKSRWVDTGPRREVERPQLLGRNPLLRGSAAAGSPFGESHLARAPPAC